MLKKTSFILVRIIFVLVVLFILGIDQISTDNFKDDASTVLGSDDFITSNSSEGYNLQSFFEEQEDKNAQLKLLTNNCFSSTNYSKPVYRSLYKENQKFTTPILVLQTDLPPPFLV